MMSSIVGKSRAANLWMVRGLVPVLPWLPMCQSDFGQDTKPNMLLVDIGWHQWLATELPSICECVCPWVNGTVAVKEGKMCFISVFHLSFNTLSVWYQIFFHQSNLSIPGLLNRLITPVSSICETIVLYYLAVEDAYIFGDKINGNLTQPHLSGDH